MNKLLFNTKILSHSIIITIFTSCKMVKTSAPEAKNIEIPSIKQSTSNLNLPITIDLTPYLKDTEKSVPQKFNGKEENCSGVSYSYRFERNPILFDGQGPYLTYTVNGKYALNLNYCPECTHLFDNNGSCVIPRMYASCGINEPMRRVSVAYATKVDITKDYKLKSTTQLTRFETIDPCEITVFKYDATTQLKKEVTGALKKLEKEIDATISEVDIYSSVEEVWNSISKPQSLGSYGFLNIRPQQISLGSVLFDKKTAHLNLNLTFEPVITTSKKESVTIPLPPLAEHKKSNGFEIYLDIEADYDSITKLISKEICGKTVEIKKNKIQFDALGIASTAGKQLNLWVKFSGKKKGTLYLVGTPTFDEENQIISFPDLEFDLHTKNALLKSAEWLFSRKITDAVRNAAIIDLKPELSKMIDTLNNGMNGTVNEVIELKSKITDLRIIAIYPDFDQLIIRTSAKGNASISL